MDTTSSDIVHRFTNHPPNHEAAARLDKITAAMIEAGQIIEAECPPGRERSLAITNLEQASMWSKAAIARNQDGR